MLYILMLKPLIRINGINELTLIGTVLRRVLGVLSVTVFMYNDADISITFLLSNAKASAFYFFRNAGALWAAQQRCVRFVLAKPLRLPL